MKKYRVVYGMNEFISSSRNAKKFARDLGTDVVIYTQSGKFISAAKLGEDGRPRNVIL